MLVAVIVACEIGFWVLVGAGLVARYGLRRRHFGGVLLAAAPLVDLVLLTASVMDLRAGGTATLAHALAAVYLGVSVGFGHRMVRRTDAYVSHRFDHGPPVPRAPRHGAAKAAHERAGWYRHAAAWAVGTGLMWLAVAVVSDPGRTDVLASTARLWTLVVVLDGVFSFSYTLFPRRPQDDGGAGITAGRRPAGRTGRGAAAAVRRPSAP